MSLKDTVSKIIRTTPPHIREIIEPDNFGYHNTGLHYSRNLIGQKNRGVKLLQNITVTANQAFGIDEVLKGALKKICAYTGCEVGQGYIADSSGKLKLEPLWYSPNPDKYSRFHEESKRIVLEPGKGLRGTVFFSGKPLWIKDITKDKKFLRNRLARLSHLKSAFAIPILIRKETVGVLEFLSTRTIIPDNQLRDVMYNIGVQLGRVVERQRALDALRDSEAKFRAVAESANEAIISADKFGLIVYINKSAEKIFGYRKSELIGKPIHTLMPERFSSQFKESFTRFNKDHVGHIMGKNTEMAGRRKDGSEFPLELSLASWETSSGTFFTGMIRDITDRKLAEEKLIRSGKQLNDAQHLAHLGSFERDLRNNQIVWSEEMYNIYGLKRNEFDGSFASFLKRVHPEDRERVRRDIEDALRTVRPFEIELKILRPDKEVRLLHVRGDFEKDINNNFVRLMGTCQDITDLKKAERELKRTYDKLKETQNELIHSEKLAALGRFSSGIAHEIRNPLANISALAQIVMSRDGLDRSTKQHLKYILENTEIANKIIQDLLSFASPEDAAFQPGDVGKVINRLCNIVEQRCVSKKVKLVKKVPHSLPRIMFNEKRLRTAFMNFISNSLDAMPRGGNLCISAFRNYDENEVNVTFEDTGHGISSEYMDKIFEPFFTTKDTGTGLGLSLAYQVIRSHSGKMEIQSKINEGTKIIVRFPFANVKHKL